MWHAGVARVEASKLGCGVGGAVRCCWELRVLVSGLHARREGLEVGRMCVVSDGWVCGVVSRMAFVGMRDVGV